MICSMLIVFTRAERGEKGMLGDLRARAMIYELSISKNAVVSMAWDPVKNTLYAATASKL